MKTNKKNAIKPLGLGLKIIICLLMPFWGYCQIKLDKKITLLSGAVEILVPSSLMEMKSEMFTFKYHSLPRPQLVLSDSNAEINLLGNTTEQPVSEIQLGSYKDISKNTLKKRPDTQILEDGIKEIRGRKVAYIKFISQATDQKVFNYYFFTSVKGKLLLFSFNCIQKLEPVWEKPADGIMNSLIIR